MRHRPAERVPELRGEHHFIADNASVIGSVIFENNVSVWFNAVRGDNEAIRIGANSNIQDGAVLHTCPGAPLRKAGQTAWKKSYAIILNPQYPCIWSCWWML